MDWSLWDVIWTTFVVFVWISVLVIFVNVVVDVFHSRDLGGGAKALWLLVLVLLPFLGLLIYLLVRGDGMAERWTRAQTERADELLAAAGASPADEIGRAKALLDQGAITEDEFAQIKRSVVAG